MKYSVRKTLTFKKSEILVIILLLTVGCNIFGSNSEQGNIENDGEWSEPQTLFTLRAQDTVDDSLFHNFNTLQATVQRETIRLVTNTVQGVDTRILNLSEILFLQKKKGGTTEIRQLTQRDIPSEQPTILRDNDGIFHLLWGDRRQDPNFDQWEAPFRLQLASFSTNVVYSRYNGTSFEPPVSIYEGNLSTFGVGDIGFPIQLIEAEDHRLHTVFKADTLVRTTTTMGDSVTAFIHRLVYINRSPAGEWSRPRFLTISYKDHPRSLGGSNPVIAAPTANRLVVAWLGSVGDVNDVLAITSDDGGQTWSEAQRVSTSGQQANFFLTIRKAPAGTLHLVWAKLVDNVLPEEMWHSYSEDGGTRWSQPERFFTLRKPTFTPADSPRPSETIISDYDIVVNENSRLHWAGLEVFFEDSLQNKIHYTSWDPGTKTWEEPSMLEFASDPGKLELAVDKATRELYLFWSEGKTTNFSVK